MRLWLVCFVLASVIYENNAQQNQVEILEQKVEQLMAHVNELDTKFEEIQVLVNGESKCI